MSRKICVEFTDLELRMILVALSNSTNHGDIMQSLFPDPVERRACARGESKLREARTLLAASREVTL